MAERLSPHPSETEGCGTRKFEGIGSGDMEGLAARLIVRIAFYLMGSVAFQPFQLEEVRARLRKMKLDAL